MSVVTEGVETLEEVSHLQSLSCNEIQGYIVSVAVVASEMAKMMLKRFLFTPPLNDIKFAPV